MFQKYKKKYLKIKVIKLLLDTDYLIYIQVYFFLLSFYIYFYFAYYKYTLNMQNCKKLK